MKYITVAAVAVLSGLCATYSWAAPTINSVTGTFGNKQAVTIAGSGFGVKSPAKPYFWAPFDDGSINPSSLGTKTSWDNTQNMGYNANEGVAGTGCAKATNSAGIWTMGFNSSDFAWNDYNKKMYVYKKIKRNFEYPAGNAVNANGTPVNWKSFRIWPLSGSYPNVYVGESVGNVVTESGISSFYFPATEIFKGALNVFNIEEIIIKSNSSGSLADGSFKLDTNGVEAIQVPVSTKTFKMNNGSGVPMVRVYPVHGVIANETMGTSDRYWADDVYVDTTWARVMVGNASTWSASTHKEIQIPQSWNDSQIQISVNQGSYPANSSAYLYVIDANGNVSPGKQITFGSSVTGTPAPANLKVLSP